jgi:hypothetical protein
MLWGKLFILFVFLLVVAVAIYRFSGGAGGYGMQDISQNNINSALLVFGTLGAGYVIYRITEKYNK